MREPFHESDSCLLFEGDCLDVLRELPDDCIDSICCDPPYGLKFMSKKWDHDVPSVDVWSECLRVLKPGGHLLSFAGTRTAHRMTVNIEDAGFEIRDMIAWVYGSGFPKSLDVSKAIDKAAGVEREVIGSKKGKGGENLNRLSRPFKNDNPNASGCGAYGQGAKQKDIDINITKPATEDAQKWEGWGTATKPALEPITVARKPLSEKTVAANVLKWGTGAINIDGCRVEMAQGDKKSEGGKIHKKTNGSAIWGNAPSETQKQNQGRWPANLIHDGSQEVLDLFPETSVCGGDKRTTHNKGMFGIGTPGKTYQNDDKSNRSAARFFYCAKASKRERGEGNRHPTVKPISLMRYLVRLVTPLGGTVLDPFMGTGTTGLAASLEGFEFIGIEREKQYIEIAQGRINDKT